MKQIILLFLSFIIGLRASAQTIELELSATAPLSSAPVVISLKPYGLIRSAVVRVDGKETACQLDDINHDGRMDELSFLVDMQKNEKKSATIFLSSERKPCPYPALTYAEMVLRNPQVKEKNRHDIYLDAITIDKTTKSPYNVLHHHGVAFENELIAARIYMDARQTIDLYGKFHKGLELHDTQFYTSKAQKAQGYGDDVLWVGNSFGLGALRGWDGTKPLMLSDVEQRSQRIITQGPIRTIVEMSDRGWTITPGADPVNMTIRYTLYAGHRDILVEATINQPQPGITRTPLLLSTGIINVKGSSEYTDHQGLRGCWGTDWPATDTINWKRETVGLGICIPSTYLVKELPADSENYTYVVRTVNGQLCYAIAYTSDNEEFGYHSAKTWREYLRQWKRQLTHPLTVKIKASSDIKPSHGDKSYIR